MFLGTRQACFSTVPGPGHLLQILPGLSEVNLGVLEGPNSIQALITFGLQGPALLLSLVLQPISGLDGLPIGTSTL